MGASISRYRQNKTTRLFLKRYHGFLRFCLFQLPPEMPTKLLSGCGCAAFDTTTTVSAPGSYEGSTQHARISGTLGPFPPCLCEQLSALARKRDGSSGDQVGRVTFKGGDEFPKDILPSG